jgi:acyl-CoA synthetase (AMP-forming)/AMP-acid ligase II
VTILGLIPSDAAALIEGSTGRTVTYRELLARGRDLAAALGDDRALLFLLAHNDVDSAVAYAGALAHGHAVALLDAGLPIASLFSVLDAYNACWVAGPAGTTVRIVESGLKVASVAQLEGTEVLRLEGKVPPRLHADLSLLLSTSGTTGSRRFVRLSTANVQANAASIASYLGLDDRERPVTSLPLHYTFGLSVLNSHWLAGAAVVMTDVSLVQPNFWEIVRSRGCTSLAGVPFTFQILERVGFRDMDLPTLTTLQQAGGALDAKLTRSYAEFMASRGGRLFVMYGQTEATARMTYVPPERLLDKAGSAGIAIPGGRLRIDSDGSDLHNGPARGEVIYEGPNVMLGYAAEPADLARGDDLRGVLRTGDLGYIDEDGYLFLVGRSKRIAKVFGVRVNLDEVETIVREYGPAAVVAGEDSIWAFCTFGTAESMTRSRDELARRLRVNRNALHLCRVDELPIASTGKIDYRRVQSWVPA